jgi:hypothetical protein
MSFRILRPFLQELDGYRHVRMSSGMHRIQLPFATEKTRQLASPCLSFYRHIDLRTHGKIRGIRSGHAC